MTDMRLLVLLSFEDSINSDQISDFISKNAAPTLEGGLHRASALAADTHPCSAL
uniref:Uncharacterized protein n=1 Tax=Anguilla anguilla TaxID=7936 RepID=A0A0E9SMU8_ANGAN